MTVTLDVYATGSTQQQAKARAFFGLQKALGVDDPKVTREVTSHSYDSAAREPYEVKLTGSKVVVVDYAEMEETPDFIDEEYNVNHL